MSENIVAVEQKKELSQNSHRAKLIKILFYLVLLFSLFIFLSFLIFLGTGYSSSFINEKIMISGRNPSSNDERLNSELITALSEKTLFSLAPTKTFVVIDRIHNILWLNENGKVTLEAKISAGAGSILKDPKTKREWIFDTPTGRFRVKGKRERPLWTAPDWEFIEANEPFPKNYADRTEEGMLGEYALDLDIPGYMIHGTLYERLIGRNVTHGCVRVGRDNLRILWKKVPIGSTVFIF